MALGDHSQFVDLSNSLLDCFTFDPTDGLQPSISHIAANLEITGCVNTETVKIPEVLGPKNQAARYADVAGRQDDIDAYVSVSKNVCLIEDTLRGVRSGLKGQLTILHAQPFTRHAPARIQVSKFIFIENLTCLCA